MSSGVATNRQWPSTGALLPTIQVLLRLITISGARIGKEGFRRRPRPNGRRLSAWATPPRTVKGYTHQAWITSAAKPSLYLRETNTVGNLAKRRPDGFFSRQDR